MKVAVVGMGYVGLTLSVVMAESGFTVCGVECNSKTRECIQSGKAHFYEPGINNLIQKHLGSNLLIYDKVPHDFYADTFIITVGTPLCKDGITPNYEYITQALDSILSVFTGEELIVLRSTVSAGTSRGVVIPYVQEKSGICEDKLMVSFCPERSIEGNALSELKTLPQIISGNNEVACIKAASLFSVFTETIIQADSLEEAEVIKLFNNCYRDMWFSIGNTFCMAAQQFGVDGVSAIKRANMGYTRSKIPMPGFVGGPCIGKDAYLLTHNMTNSLEKSFITDARHLNEQLENYVVDWVKKTVSGIHKREKVHTVTVAISGLAFKGSPDTSDMRGSCAVNVAKELVELGYNLRVHDFMSDKNELMDLDLGMVFDDFYDCVQDADIVLILNNNRRYNDIVQWCSEHQVRVLDLWSCCGRLESSNRFLVDTCGSIIK